MSVNDPEQPQTMTTTTPLKTAWAFGPYRTGMGKEGSHARERYAVEAIKKELFYLGYTDVNISTSNFGNKVKAAVEDLQTQFGLEVDGKVGPKTANALWKKRIEALQDEHGIPGQWLRALIHWESLDDPGARNPAEGTYPDGSADLGLAMLNSIHKPLSEDEAFSPEMALAFAANYLENVRRHFKEGDCNDTAPSPAVLAVGAWRTPVGAADWCQLGDLVVPSSDGTWGQMAAYYVDKVGTIGKSGWSG